MNIESTGFCKSPTKPLKIYEDQEDRKFSSSGYVSEIVSYLV